MATGKVTEAVQTGQSIRITVEVDEGPVGIVAYTALVRIADLKALGSQGARTTMLKAAIVAERDKRLINEAVIDKWLAGLSGAVIDL